MRLTNSIKTLGLAVADLVFPVYCLVCGSEGQFLCASCIVKLPRLEKQKCLVCEKPAPYGKTHLECVSRNKIDGIISALPYRDPKITNLIETYKYKFIDDLSPSLAELLVSEIQRQSLGDYFREFTIIPVPLHKRRLNWRGFNQAELISDALGRSLNIPVDKTLVTRNRFTKPQVKMDRSKRLENVTGAFGVSANSAPSRYLIVDDVVTTGATLNEIAKLLKQKGSPEVWATTVAHG